MPKFARLSMRGFIHVTSSLSVSSASFLNTHSIPARARARGAFPTPDLGRGSASQVQEVAIASPFHSSSFVFSAGRMSPNIFLRGNNPFLSMSNNGHIGRMSTSHDSESTNNGADAMQSKSLGRGDKHAANTQTKPAIPSTKNVADMERASLSLASLASSPERLAESMNMSPQQVEEAIEGRSAASTALHDRITALDNEKKKLLTPRELGKMKHRMVCRHRHEHLRNPLVCRRCWTYIPICVCPLFERGETSEESDSLSTAGMKQSKASLPRGVDQVIVWTHHAEWGRTSNTGSLLPPGLERTRMLMKGLEDHDEIMDKLLSRSDVIPVVLWPGKGRQNYKTTTISELRRKLAENNNKTGIVLISIEGTWNHARKMVNKLPSNVLRLDLGEEIASKLSSPEMNGGIFCDSNYSAAPPAAKYSSPSLLAPLRRQRNGSTGNVSTVEATVIALSALGLGTDDAGRILGIARTKVARLLEYTGTKVDRWNGPR